MASLTSLNSYSTTDTVLTVDTQYIREKEGATVELPLMAWLPVHDIGNTLAGNGVEIVHTLNLSNVVLNNGQEMTPTQYDAYIANGLPTYANVTTVGSNVSTSNAVTHYNPYSIHITGSATAGTEKSYLYASGFGNTFSIGSESYTIEGWANVIKSNSVINYTQYLFDNNSNAGTDDGWSVRWRRNRTGTSPNFVYTEFLDVRIPTTPPTANFQSINLTTANANIGNTWSHIALVRNSGVTKAYINGNHVGNSISSTSNIVATNTVYIGSDRNQTTSFLNGYFDQVRYSNTARYTGNFVPSGSVWTQDNNTILLIGSDSNGNIVQAAQPGIAENSVLNWPLITLDRQANNPNVSMSNTSNASTKTYTITGVRTPEDYLAAGAFLHFAPGYYGTGNVELNGTGNLTTRIKNSSVSTYDYFYPVNVELQNTNDLLPASLANILYASDSSQTLTTSQSPRISDVSIDGIYTIAVTTQSSPTLIQLSVANGANLTTNTWTTLGNGYGRLTLVGNRDDVNAALGGVIFTTSGNATANMTAVASGNSSISSDSVFTAIGTQPNNYVGNNVGSLSFTGSTGSTGGLTITSDTNTNAIQAWLGDRNNPATLEFWWYEANDESTSKLICDFGYRSGGVTQQLTKGYSSGINYWNWVVNGTTIASKQITVASWHHTAFVRGSSAMRWYIDGILVASIAYPAYELLMNLPIFGQSTGSNGGVGKLDEFRISNSARYVANFGTTPAINRLDSAGVLQPLEVDTNTLALWRMDTGTYPNYYTDTRYTVYDIGYLTWQSTSPYGFQSSLQGLYKNEDTP